MLTEPAGSVTDAVPLLTDTVEEVPPRWLPLTDHWVTLPLPVLLTGHRLKAMVPDQAFERSWFTSITPK